MTRFVRDNDPNKMDKSTELAVAVTLRTGMKQFSLPTSLPEDNKRIEQNKQTYKDTHTTGGEKL